MLKFSEALRKAAAKCSVRECDEEQAGRFVAYVDEGEESFDVALELDAERKPLSGNCDCANKKPCRHIAALYLFVESGQAPHGPAVAPAAAKAKRPGAKQSPAEALLQEVPVQDLRQWLLEVFANNKDVELAFVNRFSAAKDLSAGEVTRLSQDAIKTVMGRKRIPDATMITKLAQLWKDLHKSVVARYQAAPASRDAFDALAAAAEVVMDFASSHAGTPKLQKYARQLFGDVATQVSLLRQDEAFYQAAGFALMHVLRQPYDTRITGIEYLRSLGELLEGPRLGWFAENLGSQFLLHASGRHLDGDARYRLMVLGVLRKAGVFRDYADAFQTRSWDAEFNIPLIDAWREAGMFEKAEAAVWKEIDRNTKDSHDPPYYDALQRVYQDSGNREGLAKLLGKRLPQTFNFDDYLTVLQALKSPSEKRELRNKIYTAARNSKSPAANAFVLHLTIHEGNWDRVLEMIARDELRYADVDRHFVRLFNHDQTELLRALMQRRDWDAIYKKDGAAIDEQVRLVVEKVLQHYPEPGLRRAISTFAISYQYSTAHNRFRPMILDALAGRQGE